MEWTSRGRDAYMAQLAAEGQKYNQLLEQYNSRRAEFDREKEAARARHAELVQNEDWKRLNCKLCPNCGRVIHKVSLYGDGGPMSSLRVPSPTITPAPSGWKHRCL